MIIEKLCELSVAVDTDLDAQVMNTAGTVGLSLDFFYERCEVPEVSFEALCLHRSRRALVVADTDEHTHEDERRFSGL